MAKTAIVNPRKNRKRRRRNSDGTFSGGGSRSSNPRKRRRSYGRRKNTAAPTTNRRRRRRRNPSTAPASSVYSGGGYRKRNPDLFDFDHIMDVTPAATLGVWGARFAAKMAGPFEVVEANKPAVPTFKHAIALVIGAKFGSQLVGNFLGSGKESIAHAAALGFAGDLFARKRFFGDSKWVQENLLLAGIDYDDQSYEDDSPPEYAEEGVSGFEETSALGEAGQLIVGPDGQLYQLQGIAPDPAQLPGGVGGFEQTSALGFATGAPSGDSSFGYVR